MLKVVGTGAGHKRALTVRALRAIEQAQVIVGYSPYIKLLGELTAGKEIITSGMRQERERCRLAIELAREKEVVLVSSGDAGVYAMAGLVLEMLEKEERGIEVEIIPGVSAVNEAAAALGAPLMNDYAAISLSDLMTPWEVIRRRLEGAAQGDFVIALYNPKSEKRKSHIEEAREIVLKYRKGETPVGLVRNAGRENEERKITRLSEFTRERIDMSTLVIIGNSTTYEEGGRMITPRGYKKKEEEK